jgi:acetate kinase
VISTDASRVQVLVVPTNEEWEIARQALAVIRGR